MHILEVYVDRNCWGCIEARAIAQQVAQELPQVQVTVVDISETSGAYIHKVFAVPTFILNGQVVALGNPYRAEFRQRIEKLLGQPKNL